MRETFVRPASRWVSGALGCLLLLAVSGPVMAQATAPEADPLNHAFSVYLGSGIYVSENRSVFIFRIAPRIKIRSEKDHKFGIRLRFNLTFGFYDFDPKHLIELEFPDRLGTFAFVPGIEFPVNIYDNWVLIPFFDVGPATDTEFQDVNVVLGTGFRKPGRVAPQALHLPAVERVGLRQEPADERVRQRGLFVAAVRLRNARPRAIPSWKTGLRFRPAAGHRLVLRPRSSSTSRSTIRSQSAHATR